MPNKELLSLEKEMLGIYISGHPLEKLREQLEKKSTINTMQIREIDEQMSSNLENAEIQSKPKFKDGQIVKYAGIITSKKRNTQKQIS